MQSRLQSLTEAWVSTAIGFFLSIAVQVIVFPMYGMRVSFLQNIQICAILTIVSLLKSYFLRRTFNRMHNTTLFHQAK